MSETIVLDRDNGAALRFEGALMASISSSPNTAHGGRYSGETGRWMTLRLYRTRGGKYATQRISHTQWQGEKDIHQAAVCRGEAEVMKFFGYGWLAKELYAEANIACVEDIE